ncbi:MAG: type II secretion system protein GspD [Planctomycetota bacterium]|jgi:hypothetical protein
MKCDITKIGRGQWLIAIVAVLVTLSVGGCGDFTTPKTAAVESTRIIKDLRRVDPRPEPNVPLPSFFTAPPKIMEQNVGGKLEYKLFYFCQHHTSPELQAIVNTGFASILYDAKQKSTRVVDYNVHANAATNQLIVRCPTRDDAEAVLDFLREVDVPPVQVKISCLISEVYADKTLDWETTIAIQDLLGEGLTAVPTGQPFGTAIPDIIADPDTIAAFPGGSLRELARARMGLQIGYLSHSENFLAMVDTLESQGYLKVLMNPTLEVVNGKQAKVMSSQRVPVTTTYLRSGNSDLFETRLEYQDVVDSLTITPHVFADGYVGLETDILLGSKLTPEGIKQVPIVTKKQIQNKENRIRPGESLVIGGLRKSERRDVLRGVPILKDIPLLGILFSGRDFEERAVETIFVLTPTISTGGKPREEVVDDIKRRRGEPTGDDEDTGIDPFGSKARAKAEERMLEEAEEARLEAEAEKAIARSATRDAEFRIERAESEVALAKSRSARTVAKAQKMIEEAHAAKTEAEAKAKAADEAKAAADKATAEAAKVKADAAKATADAAAKVKAAEKAQADAAKIAADATKSKAEADEARADADALAKAAEKAKAEAEAKAKAADEAKEAADKAIADAAATKDAAEKAQAEADAKIKAAEEATADALQIKTNAVAAKAEAAAKVKAAEEAKAEAEAKAKAAEEARAAFEAKAAAADRAVAEAEKIIGGPASDPNEGAEGTAKAEEPAPEGEEPSGEGVETDPNKPVPAKDDEQEDTVVAKDKPEAAPKSTPLDSNKGDMLAKPVEENRSTLDSGDKVAEKPTAKQVGELSEQAPVKPSGESGQAKVAKPFTSTEKVETDIAKADLGDPKVVSKKMQGEAAKPEPEVEDPRTRLLMLVLSALSL